MQIQSWMRGRLVILRLRKDQNARLKLQCFARRCLSRQEYLQRKFIFMLIQTAEQERTKRVAAMLIQEQYRSSMERRRRDEAARVIQRFFLMVKREVDRMIRATKRRRNWKKKMKNRTDKAEDALLEDAWLSAVSHSNIENEPFYHQISNLASTCSRDELPENENDPQRGPRSRSREPTEKRQQRQRSNSAGRGGNPVQADGAKDQAKKKHRLPPGYSDKPSTIVRLHHDDDQSEFSGLTASTANFMRLPPSRMRRLGSREMDEDLELEEAFIDAEIYSAKERRMADKRSSHKQRSSSPAPSKRSYVSKTESSKGPKRRPARVKVLTSTSS
jgi:hypothetical protein